MRRFAWICIAALLAGVAGCEDDAPAPAPPQRRQQPAPTPPAPQPATAPEHVATPATLPDEPSEPAATTTQPAEPADEPSPEIPNPLASARVGQQVRYRNLVGERTERRQSIIGVRRDMSLVRIEQQLFDASGNQIGQPMRSQIPAAGRQRPEPDEVVRVEIETPAGTFDAVRVTVRGRDVDGRPYVNQTWFSEKVPLEGIVRTEVRSDGKLQRGEILIGFDNGGGQ